MKTRFPASLRATLLGKLAGIMLSLAALTSVAAPPASFNRASEQIRVAPEHASDFGINALAGRELRSSDGQVIGTIDDFILDTDSGRAVYTIVSAGGFWGLGATLYVLPTVALHSDNGGRTFTASIAKGRWDEVPKLDKADFEAGDVTLSLAIRQTLVALFKRSPADDFETLSNPVRASGLCGKEVRSGGKRVGQIEDVICDFGPGSHAEALLASNPDFTGSDRAYLVPIAKLRIESAHEDPIIAMLAPSDFAPSVRPR